MVAVTRSDTADVEEWTITDDTHRLREWGTTDTIYPLPSPHLVDATITIGASPDCWLQLSHPTNKISRRHANLLRVGGRWKLVDLNSKNGITLDGARRPSFYLTPGAEVGFGVGSVVLIAESPLLVQLRGFLERLIGWSDSRQADVDNALRSVRFAAARRESLLLCGAGMLDMVARLLHNRTLGEHRPFVVCNPGRTRAEADARSSLNYDDGLAALRDAVGGTICVWKDHPLPGFDVAVEKVARPTSRVQLVVCSEKAPDPRLPPMGPTIVLTPLSERTSELARIVKEFGRDAAETLGGSLTQASVDWVIQHESKSISSIATATRRLVALNSVEGNLTAAASLIGMGKSSLRGWFDSRPKGYT